MEKLLSNIGHIITMCDVPSVQNHAHRCLASWAQTKNMRQLIGDYMHLCCQYIEAMDRGAQYDVADFTAELTRPWLEFEQRHIVKGTPSALSVSDGYNNADYFPLLAAQACADVGETDDQENNDDAATSIDGSDAAPIICAVYTDDAGAAFKENDNDKKACLDGLEQLGYYG